MNFARIEGIIIQNIFWVRRSLEEVVESFFYPLMDVVIWGFLTVYLDRLEGIAAGVVGFLLGGLILWNIVSRSQQDITFGLLKNVWSRNILNIFASPLTPVEFIAAIMISGFLKILFTTVLVSVAAFFLYSFNIFSLGLYLVPFFANLIIFAWAVGIFIVALIIRYGMRLQAFAWSLIVVLQPVSAVFYPVGVLPGFLQKIAWFLPVSHIFEGMREILRTGTTSNNGLIAASILNIVYIVLAGWFFVFMFEKARGKGKLAKSDI